MKRISKVMKMMVLALVAVAMVSTLGTVDAQAASGKVKEVQITGPTKKTTYTIKRKNKNVTVKMKYKVNATKGASKKVTFKSSNAKVVSVSKTGVLTAKKAGTAKITVTSKANKKKKDTITIKVEQLVTGMNATVKKSVASFDEGSNVTLKVGGKGYTVATTFTGAKPSNKKVAYKSSNKKVVTVSKNGKVTAKKAGTAKITVTAQDGSKKKAVIDVKVLPKKVKKVTKVTATPGTITLDVVKNKTATIKAKITPAKATYKKVVFYSSNEKVAKVGEESGKVTAVSAGTATITVKTLDGSKKTAKVTVVVKDDINTIAFDKTSASKVYVGKTATVAAAVNADAYDTKVTYSIAEADQKFATVDAATGVVTGKARATVEVIATAANGKTAKTQITIVDAVVTKVTPVEKSTATVTVTFAGDMAKVEADILALVQQAGLQKDASKVITVNGKAYTAKYDGKALTFDGKKLAEVANGAKEVKVSIGANAIKFVNGLQLAQFKTATYKYDITIGGYTFKELNVAYPYMTLKTDKTTYSVYAENGSIYFVGELEADVVKAIENVAKVEKVNN